MRPTALFITYPAVALVIGALPAYPVYVALGPVTDDPMYRFVTRTGELVALIAIVWFLRFLDLNNSHANAPMRARKEDDRCAPAGTSSAGWIVTLLLCVS